MPLANDLSYARRRQGRKKDEALRIVVPRTKTSSKWPSDAEVASVKPVKWTKNVAPSLAVSPAVARVSTGASGCSQLREESRGACAKMPCPLIAYAGGGFFGRI
jgi:hypothetical protein